MVSFVRAPRVLEKPAEVQLTPSQRATVHMAASLLLDYPAEGTLETRLNAVEAELATLPAEVAVLLEEFIAQARRRGERAMAEHYVEVFDRRRRCCLYLTYYTVGDTRHRGAALLAFKQALAAAGYEMAADELPDYLPVVLELSARSGDEVASALLSSHREGIEVLRSALVDVGSPYARLVEAVSMTLPRIDAATADRLVADLLTVGASQNRGTLLVTHRLSALAHADEVMVMGRPPQATTEQAPATILHRGSHDSLQNVSDAYRWALSQEEQDRQQDDTSHVSRTS